MLPDPFGGGQRSEPFNSKAQTHVQPRVTLKTIAAEAGLSAQAVSMALRDHHEIAPATRERVQALARDLGYTPDPGLRALADYRTRRRGVSARWSEIALVHNWESPAAFRGDVFHRELLRHVTRAAEARGIRVSVHWLGAQGARTASVFHLLRNRGITGVFVAPPALTMEEPRVEIPRGPFQVVTFGPGHLYRDHHTVQSDYYENLRLAWRMLTERGRRRIGLAHHKRQGWRTGHAWRAAHHVEALAAGHVPGDLPPLELEDPSAPEARETYRAWVSLHHLDAVISSLYELPDWNRALKRPPEVATFNVRGRNSQGIDLRLDQMAETAVELLLLEMQRSLVHRTALPFRVLIPGRWVDA